MNSPPSKDNSEETVLVPGASLRPTSATGVSSGAARGASGSRFSDTSFGDPHSPSIDAESVGSGIKGAGNALPIGTYLGEFELTQVIGEGGFGIVYLAIDHSLQRRVAVKEYMPSSLAERSSGMQVSSLSREDEETFRKGLNSFINEARLLAQFDHPSLVKVHRFWEANGTAYMVMPFYKGPTLKETLRDMPGPPDEAWLLALLDPLTQALAVIHENQCYHRDIAPDNILLLSGSGRPLLLDFGAARKVIGDANQALTVILKPGYAPFEQYGEVPGMHQGPWTDLYALAAVLYFAITGKNPPASVARVLKDQYVPLEQTAAGRYSVGFLRGIDRALAVKPTDRTQEVGTFRTELGLAPLLRDESGALAVSGGTPSTFGESASRPLSSSGVLTSGAPSAKAAGGKGKLIGVGLAITGMVLSGGTWWWLSRPAAPPPAEVVYPSDPGSPSTQPPGEVLPGVAAAPAVAVPYSVVGEFKYIVEKQTRDFMVEARLTKASLRINKDIVKVNINSSRDGYFYVMTHTPDGQLFQYFPNLDVPSNQILAGQSLTLPQPSKDPATGKVHIGIELTEPPGQADLLVIVSKFPRDFSALGTQRIGAWQLYPTGLPAETLARWRARAVSIYAGEPICPARGTCIDEYGASRVEVPVVR